MLEKIYINEPRHTDMSIYRCGFEDCKAGHFWGPAVRDHYIIHYILGGKGTFTVNGTNYMLGKNDGFLICPDTVVYYKADYDQPWSYAWVGFHGLKAASYLKQSGLDNHNPIFKYTKDDFLKNCLLRMIATKQLFKGKEIRLLGLLYEFLSQLVETAVPAYRGENSTKEEYVKKALEYIAMNYSRSTSVAEIACSVGLDRSYLYSLFKEVVNLSPQKYLINYRMEKACDLMHTTSLTLSNIARSVGYNDPLMFSRAFKKAKGMSPRDFRKKYS